MMILEVRTVYAYIENKTSQNNITVSDKHTKECNQTETWSHDQARTVSANHIAS